MVKYGREKLKFFSFFCNRVRCESWYIRTSTSIKKGNKRERWYK